MPTLRPTVIITRPEGTYAGADRLRDRVEQLGFRALVLPILRVEQLSLTPLAKELVRKALAAPHQWISFLSPSAVFVFKNVLERMIKSTEIPETILIAAQGKGTAEAIQACFGRRPDFLPTIFVAEEFANQLADFMSEDSVVFVPQSADGRDVFGPILRARGFTVDSIDTYCLVDAPLAEELWAKVRNLRGLDPYIVFMSPSAVRATVRLFKDERALLESFRIMSVGPVTSKVVTEHALQLFAEATEYSEDGVIAELKRVVA